MECEKPKSRRKKKVKNSQSETREDSSASLEEFEIDLKELQDLCIEMKSDSSENEASEKVINTQKSDNANSNFLNIETETQKEISEVCVQPSAPIVEVAKPNSFSFQLTAVTNETLYPDLKLVEDPKTNFSEKILSPIAMRPFSTMEIEHLYSNPQIKKVEIFETEFIEKELKDVLLQEHYLYTLLKKYSKARSRFLKNTNDAEKVLRKLEENYNSIWTIQSKVASAHGFCACGRVLRATHTYNYALFSEEIFGDLEMNLKKLQIFASHNHVKFLQESIMYHRQIEQLINELMNDSVFKNITNDSPIVLNEKIDDPNLLLKMNDLRTYISVLFKFFREIPQDKKVQTDVKGWIKQLVALQIRIGTWEDHVFILFHVLRCKDGVGNWASCFIQIPSIHDSFTKYDLLQEPDFKHCISILHIILMPISKRKVFLEEYLKDVIASKNKSDKDLWILVDSDGEDGSSSSEDYSKLKENDLVMLFDQINFELIFKTMCFAYKNDGNYILDIEKISFGHNVIKIIAFASNFITIIRNGLLSITEHHKQFAKRLGKLIKEILLYLRDIVIIYQSIKSYKDPEQYQRIQLEYDELVIRSTSYIYESKKLSLFQYLADFPYELLSSKAIWKLFYCLHIGDFNSFNEDSTVKFDKEFVEKFNHDLAMDDMLFLLHTFTKMALCKRNENKEFLSFVLKDLIHIGFINDFTKDFCYNTVKGLVADITNKNCELVGDVIAYIQNNLYSIGSLSTYLLKSLPIDKWKPNQKDLELFSSWLLNYDFDTIESSTARFIIASINWNFDQDNQLFIPHEIHVRMAHLVCEVYMKYVGESSKCDFNETKFIGKIGKNSTKKDKFSVWCWSMISLLRLHQTDINPITIMKNPNILNSIPEIEELNIVYQGATEKKPLPIYISFLISRYGHSVPQICHKGFEQLNVMLSDHRYLKVIRCLELITPLFLHCTESLHQCDAFLSILEVLIKADKVNGITEKEYKCTVLKLLGNMILNQLNSYQTFGLNSPYNFVHLWLCSFLKLKNWNKDERITIILEMICQFSYAFSDTWNMIKETLRMHVQTIAVTKILKSSGLFSFVMSEEVDILLSPFDNAPTLSMLILECEHENIEVNTGYWNDLIYQLSVQRDLALENIHKSLLQSKQMTYFPLKNLVIFKLAKLICNCSLKSFIFPILCQQFFVMYFSRIFIDISNDSRGVQEKFYNQDITLMKKLKRKLEESEKYHNDIATNESNGEDSHFHTNLSKIFKTFLLWLEENQLNSIMQKNIVLPPLYEGEKLKQIFQGNKTHWTEFINIQKLRSSQRSDCDSWLKFCMRHRPQVFENVTYESENPEDEKEIVKRICDRLKLSEKSSENPPELIRKSVFMGKIDLSKDFLQLFRAEANILKKTAHQYMMMINEHKAVDAVYRDSIRLAYSNENTFRMKMATCSKLLDNCQGSLSLKVEFCEMKVNEGIRHMLEDNRDYHKKLISKELKDFDPKITDANLCLQNILHQLIVLYSTERANREKNLNLMKKLFYELIGEIDNEILEYPITNEFYSNAITTLGSFIQQYDCGEMLNILKLALQRPLIMNLFAEVFAPSNSTPNTFIGLYECLVNMYGKNYEPQALFVLLSKFDLPTFLQVQRPKLVEVSELIRLIFRGLELWSIENSELLQDVLRCHLVHVFLYRFPEHYGEILQCILTEFSQQRLRPCILLDILNAFYIQIGCSKIDTEMSIGRMKDEMRMFASKQNLLNYNDLHSTSLMLNHYFYNERLQHGLHGIYPKFGKYCDVLSALFGTIGHSVISAAIKAFPDASADYLVNELYPCISNMYAPMLVPLSYSQSNMKDTPANWIQQLSTGNTILQPWSNVQTENAEKFIRTYAMCLQYMFDMLPSSNLLIQHLFSWYLEYFAHKTTPKYVLSPIQLLLTKMPFERLLPTLQHLEGINRVLMDFSPDCHTFLGNIFLRIPWTQWLSIQFQTLDYNAMQRTLAILLITLIKLSYEPKVRESIRILQLLQDAIKYPWNSLDYKDVENALDWFVMSAEPSMILKVPSEHELVDQNVHLLLQTISCMHPLTKETSQQQTVVTAKRMAYVRSIVRIFKCCDAKLHQLLSTKKGQQMFNESFKDFLNLIDNCVQDQMEATNLVVTVTDSIAVPESVANLFASGIQEWQENCKIGSVTLCCFLNALKIQKFWSIPIFRILNSTLTSYMRTTDSNPEHKPSWLDTLERLPLKTEFDIKVLLDSELYMTIHFLAISKMTQLSNDEDRLDFLIDLQTKLSSQKTTESTEPGYCLIWSFLLMSYQHLLKRTEKPKKQLLTIANYLQTTYNQTEGWGDGLLGAIGLKKDPETNDKKFLLRCFSCSIFGLISSDAEFENSVSVLRNFLDQKKFTDLKMKGFQAINLIENKRATMSDDFHEVISKIIRIFYKNSYLYSIEKLYYW